MTFADNYQCRKSLVAWLKANATILATLDDSSEIREKDWQAEDYTYPNIRVTCAVSTTQCTITDGTAIISYYSEKKSSKQAIQSQGIIAKQLHNTGFTSESIKISSIRNLILPDAEQVLEGVWKADVQFSFQAVEVT